MCRFLACLIALAALGLSPVYAAVANQSCVPTVGSTTGKHFTANTTFSLTNVTVSAGSNLAITFEVDFDITGATTPTVSSVVWDQAGANQSFSQTNAGYNIGSTGANSEQWGLVNPTPGSNKTITVVTSSSQPVFLTACIWTGVDQTGGATSFPHHAAQAGGTTVNITSASGNIVVGGAASGGTISGITGTTIYSDSVSGAAINAFANYMPGAASVTIGEAGTVIGVLATDIHAAAGGGGSSCIAGSLALLGAGC